MEASIDHVFDEDRLFLRPLGEWVIDEAHLLDRKLRDIFAGAGGRRPRHLVIDLSQVETLDTAGVFLLARAERRFVEAGGEVDWQGADRARVALVERVREALAEDDGVYGHSHTSLLQDVGATILSVGADARRLLVILGGTVQEFVGTLIRPSSFRASAVGRQMELAGVRAVPIIILMSFLIGGIVAQQGAFQLNYFGAAIFTVDLVGILSLREVAPLLTAIMVAGRSGSAITAELGSMRMREEIDALRVMGLDPVNVLVLPRVLALILILPLLTFVASLATLLGAMLTLWFYVEISPDAFIERLRYAIDFSSLFSGLFKAPFMALIIGLIAMPSAQAISPMIRAMNGALSRPLKSEEKSIA
ncbi:MAG TPA: ABC transporter permease [Alphaproteobacteria bacterium]|nr:ABC transporter permease [Alphaproteobacteria bacterium]